MTCSALILTGGSGNRFNNGECPKQFCEILGKPVFIHTLELYEEIEEITDIYLVINSNYTDKYNDILRNYSFKKLKKLIAGGDTRQDSIEKGLLAIDKTDLVIIQDGVNPTVPPNHIMDCIKAAQIHGACTSFEPARHTVFKVVNGELDFVLERGELGYTLAPQVYDFKLLLSAFENAKKTGLRNRPTVDLVKRIGHKVVLVHSKLDNVKLTSSLDLITIEDILRKRKAPKVSVIIATYNRAQYICEAVDSVLAQTYKNFELIVIDDGSTDNTKSVLDKYVDKIRYLYQENKGLASTRNLGIRLSNGEYIAFLDSDDTWLPDKLEKQIKVIEKDNDCEVVYTAKYMMDANGNLTGDIRPYFPAKNLYDLLNGYYVNMSALVKRDLFKKVGEFDKEIINSHDTDFWIRAAKITKIKFIEDPLIKYRVHSGNESANCETNYSDHIKILRKVSKDTDINVPRSFIKKRLAQEYYKLSKAQYKNVKYSNALYSLLIALKNYPLVFKCFINQDDKAMLKLKKIINPFAAIFIYSLKTLFTIKLTKLDEI